MVFIHHFGGDIFPFSLCQQVFHNGNIAVGYFFVLSGFVLFISYSHRPVSYGRFMKKRALRIMPMYLIALALFVAFAVTHYEYNLVSTRSIKEVAASVFCLQSYFPTYPLVLNGPGWSISVEMFFYLLFPALLLLQQRHIKCFVITTVILYVISQAIHLHYYPHRQTLSDDIVDTISFNPAIHLNQFMIGICGGYLFQKLKGKVPECRWLPLALLAVCVLLLAIRPSWLSYQTGLISPLFMLLIISIALNNPKVLSARPFVFSGEISYSIYILQLPVYNYFNELNNSILHIPKPYSFYCALVVLYLCATIAYYLVERPLKRLAHGRNSILPR